MTDLPIIKAVMLGGPLDGTKCEITDRPRYGLSYSTRPYERDEAIDQSTLTAADVGEYIKSDRTRSGRAIYTWEAAS